jgi:hypothetical protein
MVGFVGAVAWGPGLVEKKVEGLEEDELIDTFSFPTSESLKVQQMNQKKKKKICFKKLKKRVIRNCRKLYK